MADPLKGIVSMHPRLRRLDRKRRLQQGAGIHRRTGSNISPRRHLNRHLPLLLQHHLGICLALHPIRIRSNHPLQEARTTITRHRHRHRPAVLPMSMPAQVPLLLLHLLLQVPQARTIRAHLHDTPRHRRHRRTSTGEARRAMRRHRRQHLECTLGDNSSSNSQASRPRTDGRTEHRPRRAKTDLLHQLRLLLPLHSRVPSCRSSKAHPFLSSPSEPPLSHGQQKLGPSPSRHLILHSVHSRR